MIGRKEVNTVYIVCEEGTMVTTTTTMTRIRKTATIKKSIRWKCENYKLNKNTVGGRSSLSHGSNHGRILQRDELNICLSREIDMLQVDEKLSICYYNLWFINCGIFFGRPYIRPEHISKIRVDMIDRCRMKLFPIDPDQVSI